MPERCLAARSRGVSPVIGIVLLVLGVVVFAMFAVTFVFTESEALATTPPQTQITIQQFNDSGNVTLRALHAGGERITATNTGSVRITHEGTVLNTTRIADDAVYTDQTVLVTTTHSPARFSEGDVIRVTWLSPNGESSRELVTTRYV